MKLDPVHKHHNIQAYKGQGDKAQHILAPIHWMGDWMDSTATNLNVETKTNICPCWKYNFDYPSCRQLLD